MTHQEFINIFLIFLGLNLYCLISGFGIVRLILKISGTIEDIFLDYWGLYWLTGLGGAGFWGLILGLFHQFNRQNILIIFLTILILSSIYLTKKIPTRWYFSKKIITNNLTPLILLLFSGIILASLYMAALLPPHFQDELAYHLPEANLIISTQTINLNLDGHFFYGNIPKLIEILFAEAIVFQGYELAHLWQFSIMLAFLVLVFEVIKKNYSATTASLSVLLICLYDEYAKFAVNGYIDSATVSFEFGGLLLFLDWISSNRQISFIGSSILIALAISSKYSALITLGFIATLLVIIIYKNRPTFLKQNKKNLFIFGGIIFLISGYWYIKNLILYSNPTYPLYFGHKGVGNDEYNSLVNAIQEFGSRDPTSFLKFPLQFFNIQSLTVFYSFYLGILAFLVKKNQKFHLILLTYFLIYVVYWFFLATHQTRFLESAILSSILLTSILIANISRKSLIYLSILVLLITIFINSYQTSLNLNKTSLKDFYINKFNVFERQYGFGKIAKEQYLKSWFGCQYSVIDYLQKNNLPGNVIDNWTIWHDPTVTFYATKNQFIHPVITNATDDIDLKNQLFVNNISYIYLNSETKKRFIQEKDPVEVNYFSQRYEVENYLLTKAILIYKNEPCELYRIDLDSYDLSDNSFNSPQN